MQHTGLCELLRNISTSIWMLGKSTGLKLGEVSSLFSFYNITISELLLFSIFFLIPWKWNDLFLFFGLPCPPWVRGRGRLTFTDNSSLCFAGSSCDARRKKINKSTQRFERLLKQKLETLKSDRLKIYDKCDFKTFFYPIDWNFKQTTN